MTSHELAKRLLDMPNVEVLIGPHDSYALVPTDVRTGERTDLDTDETTDVVVIEIDEDDSELE